MKKIIFTGTGSGFPSKDRACSSFVLKIDSRLYQFDAGEGFSSSALKRRLEYNKIEKIFISHLHPDHITGLFVELQLMHLSARKKPLDIYVPQESLEGLKRATDMFYLFEKKLQFRFRFRPIMPNPAYRGQRFWLYAYLNRHLRNNERLIKSHGMPNRMQSYSFILKVGDKRLLYSGDLESEREIGGLLGGVHTAIIEGFHVDFRALVEMCVASGVRRLVLTHLHDEVFHKPEKLLKAADKIGLKRLIIACDGLQLKI